MPASGGSCAGRVALVTGASKGGTGTAIAVRLAAEGADTTWMRYPFLLDEGIDRTKLQEAFLENGVATRMVWTGNILRQPGFAGIEHRGPSDGFPNADAVMERALTLPIHHSLTSDDIGYLCDVTDQVLGGL